MSDFQVFIDDDRYAVPSFYLISACSDAGARGLAVEIWRASAHHLGVELRRSGGDPVYIGGSLVA